MTRRFAPYVLAALHALLTLAVYIQAMRDPTRSGMLPILVFTIDVPASFPIIFLARTIGVTSDKVGYNLGLLNDMAFFLVLGSAWWLAIGYGLSRLYDAARQRASAR